MSRLGTLRGLRHAPGARAIALSLVAAAAVLAARGIGLLEFVELTAYDVLVRQHTGSTHAAPPITLVAIRESDIVELRHPLPDDILARALENLLALGPRSVGIDLYRDRAVPPGEERLRALLSSDARLVALEKFGHRGGDGVSAPAYVPRDRVGFSDLPVDPGGIVRKAYLYLWDDAGEASVSLALRLASLHLSPEQIRVAEDPAAAGCIQLGATRLCPFEATDGGYVRADAGGFQMLLDYADGHAAFDAHLLDFSDVLAGRIEPASVRDRTVILGTAAASIPDQVFTPLSEGLLGQARFLRGIEVHGHAVSQLLRLARGESPPIRSWSELGEAAWILAWALVGGIAVLQIRWRWGITAGGVVALLVAGPLLAWLACVLLFAGGRWAPMVPVALAWLAATALVVFELASQDRRVVQVVGSELAAEIRRRHRGVVERGRLKPRLATLTVLLSDLQSFTAAAERMEELVLMDWLNEYMRAMSGAIQAHRGAIDAYVGDGIKADFGIEIEGHDPQDVDQAAVNAVRASLAMAAALERLNERWRARDLPLGRMRIGINTGSVTVGSLGEGTQLKYAAVGATVNMASRLESFEKASFDWEAEDTCSRILISGRTLARLGGRFETVELGEFELRGSAGKIAIHRVIRERTELGEVSQA